MDRYLRSSRFIRAVGNNDPDPDVTDVDHVIEQMEAQQEAFSLDMHRARHHTAVKRQAMRSWN